MMTRAHFIQCLAGVLLSASLSRASTSQRPPRILLRSSWQTVNIGDIGHTPGILALLEKHLPQVEVWLWPMHVDNGVDELLHRRFPKVRILENLKGREAFGECDFLLHSSGPSLVAKKDVGRWKNETGKPYGVYGITLNKKQLEDPEDNPLELLNGAQFVYFRDSVSLGVAKDGGVKAPIMEFAPDAAFAVDLRNDAAAEVFLKANALTPGKFLCCIPRLRNTPYWKIRANTPFNASFHARNEAMKEHDHAPLRAAIIEVVRKTDLKVLVCPEDRSQMEVGKEMLVDPLPDDVKKMVVWRQNYWLTDEALSTYIRSAGLFGNEMHSPIMCIGSGIPAIVCRWKEQTSKGYMWSDIGLGDWLFDLDNEADLPRIAPTVLAMAQDFGAAKAKAEKALAFVKQRQTDTMSVVGRQLSRI